MNPLLVVLNLELLLRFKMRKLFAILAFSLLLYLISCKEVGPAINKGGTDTSSQVQKKMVLIEMETGDQCVNCPQGIALAEKLADTTYPGQVAIIELHDGFLSNPYTFSPQNLQSSAAEAIDNILGPASEKPVAAIDRFIFSGETGYFVDDTKWAGYVGQRVIDTDKVNIFITPTYNSSTRQVTVSVQVKYLYDVTDLNNLNVAITENGIVDPQANQTVIDTYYVHNNVLRDLITPSTGDPIPGTLDAGYSVTKKYTYTLPGLWNAANCNIVAFVTNSSSTDIEVLQAQEVKLQ